MSDLNIPNRIIFIPNWNIPCKERIDKVNFDYVIGKRIIEKEIKEKVIGGFANLETAKKHVEIEWDNFLARGYLFIDTPEGRYIYGDTRERKMKWFSPEEREQATMYDHKKDRIVQVEQFEKALQNSVSLER